MKYIKSFTNINEEINLRDISQISSEFDNYFTVSFEFEIETEDRSDIKLNFSDLDEEISEDVISMIFMDLNLRSRVERKLVKGLIYDVLDHVEGDVISVEIFNNILDDQLAKNEREKEIIRYVKSAILSFIGIEDLQHLKKMVKRKLPNFYRKYSRRLDYVGDATLDRGIEIKPKTYLKSISEGVEMLNDFFTELNSQDYWTLSERTGLHINIGTKDMSEWNPIKGLLLLNDFSKSEKTPFVFKDMTWRLNNNFCGSLLPSIFSMSENEKQDLLKNIDLNDVESCESILNDFLYEKVKIWGIKNFGFNISKLENNYVEFRYVGGVIDVSTVVEKLKYFAFVVYCMTDRDYKRKEYLKKLYKFVENLK